MMMRAADLLIGRPPRYAAEACDPVPALARKNHRRSMIESTREVEQTCPGKAS